MNIEHIKGNRYSAQKSGKGHPVSKTNSPKSHSKSVDGGEISRDATKVSLSATEFDNEIAFSKSVLGKIQQKSLDSLKNIKQNIKEGAYDSEQVHREISTLIKNDLSTLTHLFPHTSDTGDARTISEDYKNKLLENSDVADKISNNILNDLRKI